MNFYVYNKNIPLGQEQCGTEGRHVLENCTIRKVTNLINRLQYKHYSIYSFTNFYDDKTFKLIKQV